MSIWKQNIIKLIISLFFLSACFSLFSYNSYAGSINGAEASIIAAASGSFTYKGETYHASSSALSQLAAYLSTDGIDLTDSQASTAISYMYSNVATGVRNGYIVKDSGSSDEKDKDKKDESSSDTEGKPEPETKQSSKDSDIDDSFILNQGTEESTQGNTSQSDDINGSDIESSADIVTDKDGSIFIVENGETERIYTDIKTIKDTGYCLENLWLVFFMFVTLIVIGIIILFQRKKKR